MASDPILRHADRIVTRADRASAAFARELGRVLRGLTGRLRDLLDVALAGDPSALAIAVQLHRLRQDIRNTLVEAGYDDLVAAATDAPLDALAEIVIAGKGKPIAETMVGDSGLRLRALKSLHLESLLTEADVVTRQLSRAVGFGVLGAQSPRAIMADLGNAIDQSEARIRTLYDTSVSIYGRQVEAESSAESASATFAYMGPVDKKTREFCLERVGKVFTRDEIAEMDNGQLPNAFLTGGGFNCRHVWMEVSKFSELHPLQGTGKRAPEIHAEVERILEMAA